jgi:hypothetical protein
VRFSTHSDGKFIRRKEAFSTTLLERRNVNGYAENLQIQRFHTFLKVTMKDILHFIHEMTEK